MKYIIHDLLNKDIAKEINLLKSSNLSIIDISKPMAKCVGCFHCWLKSPGECKFKDKIRFIGKELITSEETIFICQNLYGGFSSNVKRLVDRSIPGVLPFFRKLNNELHHSKRYDTESKYKVIFTNNKDITEDERVFAKELIEKVALNYHAKVSSVIFVNNEEEALQEVKKWLP
ncbi:MAG: hypothetical protein ACRC42_03215 [Mycoplasma sp.]